MKIKTKPFKTWEEQIDILNEWGNNFLQNNQEQKDQILNYLRKYNFQVFVDAFTPLLWQNFEKGIMDENQKFIENFKFNDLVDLFNFDNYLKRIINSNLEEFEKRLRTAIIYHTLKNLNEINESCINFPFILLDDKQSEIIANKIFKNNLSNDSFFINNEFDFENYVSFLIKNVICPFESNYSYSINNDFKKFYFDKIFLNHEELSKERKLLIKQLMDTNQEDNWINLENINDSLKLKCTFKKLLDWLSNNNVLKNNNQKQDNSKLINNCINILSKSFIPLYKSFTQLSFGHLIKFFSKLNEKIQIQIIKEHFPIFYKTINNKVDNKEKLNLIVISSFITFLNLFKDLRNKVAHHDVIYNFWNIYIPINTKAKKSARIMSDAFWLANKSNCDFLNHILKNKNKNAFFRTHYFKKFEKITLDYYLNKFNDLNLKVFCKLDLNKNKISFTKINLNIDTWHFPLFFLEDAINWLCVFIENKKDYYKIIDEAFNENKINNQIIKDRLKDFLFNKILISFEKVTAYLKINK